MKIKVILGINKAEIVSWGRGSGAQSRSIYDQVALAERHRESFAESISSEGRESPVGVFGPWARGCHCICQLTRQDFGKDVGGEAKGFERGCERTVRRAWLLKPNSGKGLQEGNFSRCCRRETVAQTKSTRIGFYKQGQEGELSSPCSVCWQKNSHTEML